MGRRRPRCRPVRGAADANLLEGIVTRVGAVAVPWLCGELEGAAPVGVRS